MENTDRREFMKLLGVGAVAGSLHSNIAKALAIPANNRTRSIRDVEHVVVLMQENRPFDHHFGTLQGVRGFNDPRAVNIHLPLQNSTGTVLASVFLQPAGPANVMAGYGVTPNSGALGGPAGGAFVIPPFRVDPEEVSPGLKGVGLTYLPGTNHSWGNTHQAWNQGQYDGWASVNGPMTMSYMTREDIPYHYALADDFTVGDAYHCSVLGPTNPNRTYLWSGCIGNLDGLGAGGTDSHGAGPMTANGPSPNNAYWTFPTFPEVLTAAGISWRIYQDLDGATFAPDFGDGTSNPFIGNFGDNSVLYFNQYASSAPAIRSSTTAVRAHRSAPRSPVLPRRWRPGRRGSSSCSTDSAMTCRTEYCRRCPGYRGTRRLHRAFGLARRLRRVVHLADRRHPGLESRGVQQDRPHHQLRRGRRQLRPHCAALPTAVGRVRRLHGRFPQRDRHDQYPELPHWSGDRVPFILISPWTKGGYVM